jgi:cyclic dehypoxanthinyl futalosine synthase
VHEDLFRAVKARYPTFRLHALSPPEVIHISRLSQLSVAEVVDRLIEAGLDSIPGGGAEILVDRVRKLLNCYGKATADEWLGVMRSGHRAGLRTTATMMYGTVETVEERLEHLFRLRDLQDETGGFTAFITWSYHGHTELVAGRRPASALRRRHRPDSASTTSTTCGVVVTQGGKVGKRACLRRQRHGQRHDRGERRACGRRELLHDEIEIVQHRERRLRRSDGMHYEILGDPVSARASSDAGARCRTRGRRHEPRRRSIVTRRGALRRSGREDSSPERP